MSTQQIPPRYQPAERVVDNRDRLRELYCHRNLTIREIASEYAEVGRTKVCNAIHEHGIADERQSDTTNTNGKQTDRGTDPPDWTQIA